jgi:hypothetical protein
MCDTSRSNHLKTECFPYIYKLRHYNTAVLPEALYTAETTLIQGQTKIKDIEKQERKRLQKIFGPVMKDGIWIKRPTYIRHIQTYGNNYKQLQEKESKVLWTHT